MQRGSDPSPRLCPPYSPVFNPIEGVFSIVKRHYHRHRRIEPAFASVTSDQVAGFFRGSFKAQHR
jgi:transposase